MTLTHLDLDRIDGLAERLRESKAEVLRLLAKDAGSLKAASVIAGWIWDTDSALADLTAMITRIRELEGALTEAREGCQLLEDLCACGSDDDYVTDLLAKIDAALQRKTP